ncbi:MAG: hypothetical protein ACFB6R_02105 [Alphaproteobacteria bacterium]
MVPMLIQVVIAIATYAFAIYCGVVILRNVQTRCLARDRTIACSPLLAIMLLVLIALVELLIYGQIAIFRYTETAVFDVSVAYNLVWPLLYGSVAAYVIGCVATAPETRSLIVGGVIISLPIGLALWIFAQWQMFPAIY